MTTVTWTQPEYEAVARLIGARTGLMFASSRCRDAELGIRRAMNRARMANLDLYRQAIESDAELLDDLITELTVGETYFFREPEQFEFIRRIVVPQIRRRCGEEHVIRVWSAGCASGEEAYSLAILLDDAGLCDRSHILATDISREALAKARKAEYSAWSLRGDGAAVAKPCLIRSGDRYVMDERIRRRVVFEHLNLAIDVYPSFATGTWGMDLILCRNVLIYFDSQTIKNVARRLFESLAPGGWLITGASDPLLANDAPYETVMADAGVFLRRADVGTREGDGAPTRPPQARETVRCSDAETQRTKDRESSGEDAHVRPRLDAEIPSLPRARVSTSLSPHTPQPGIAASASVDPLRAARDALLQGEYARAVELTCELRADSAASAIHVQALASVNIAEAERACATAVALHPLSTELNYMLAVLLVELERTDEAAHAARRVIYLDRSLALAHFTLGSIVRSRGEFAEARRAYQNARRLCEARPADEIVPLSDGETAGRLAEAAEAQMATVDIHR